MNTYLYIYKYLCNVYALICTLYFPLQTVSLFIYICIYASELSDFCTALTHLKVP